MRRTSSCRYSRRSRPAIVTRPCSGSRKRSSRFVTVVLPAPLGPTSATLRPGSSCRSKSFERRPLVTAVAGGHALERDRRCGRRRRRAGGRVAHRRLTVDQLEHASAGSERARELSCRRRQPGTASNEARASSASIATSTRSSAPCLVGANGDGEDADDRQPGDEGREGVGDAADQRVATGEAVELAVGRPDARERALLGAVEHQLRARPEQLVDLGGELASRLRLPPPGSPAEPARDDRYAETADERAPPRARPRPRAGTRRSHRRRRHRRRPRRGRGRCPAGTDPGARRRRRSSASAGRPGGSPRARRVRAARCARRSGCGRGRARGTPDRATRAGRRSAPAAVPARRSAPRRSPWSARGSPGAPRHARSGSRRWRSARRRRRR